QAVTDAAAEIAGAEVGAFFYAPHSNADAAGLDDFVLFAVAGAQSLERGMVPATCRALQRGATPVPNQMVCVADVATDPTLVDAAACMRLWPEQDPIRSYLAAPV